MAEILNLYFDKENIENADQIMRSARNIVITTHQNPDGDAVGSALGLYHLLKTDGIKVQVIFPDAPPPFFNWIPGISDVLIYNEEAELGKKIIAESDLIFCLDYNHFNRTGDMQVVLHASKASTIMIDHHINPDPSFSLLFFKIGASSTCELIFHFANDLNRDNGINKACATALYCGLLTDTNSFKFNTTPTTHNVAAELMEKGAPQLDIHRLIYDNNRLDRLKLWGYALSNKLVYYSKYRTAIISMSEEELNRFNFCKGDTEGLVNEALSIKEAVMAILLTEYEGKVRISFRSKGDFAVNEMVKKHFGGGGHKNAAGARANPPLEKVIERIEKFLPDYEKEINAH